MRTNVAFVKMIVRHVKVKQPQPKNHAHNPSECQVHASFVHEAVGHCFAQVQLKKIWIPTVGVCPAGHSSHDCVHIGL
jgi:hypothetical protein